MELEVEALIIITAGLEVLHHQWRLAGTERLVYPVMDCAINRLHCHAL
jgi:hypothetical protein